MEDKEIESNQKLSMLLKRMESISIENFEQVYRNDSELSKWEKICSEKAMQFCEEISEEGFTEEKEIKFSNLSLEVKNGVVIYFKIWKLLSERDVVNNDNDNVVKDIEGFLLRMEKYTKN